MRACEKKTKRKEKKNEKWNENSAALDMWLKYM